MIEKIKTLQTLAEKYRRTGAGLNELSDLRGNLESEAKGILGSLSELPAEVLALPQSGGEHFPAATTQKLRSLASVRTKLELLPGVIVRQQTDLGSLRQQLHVATRALIGHCGKLAGAKLEKDLAEAAAGLLPYYGGSLERAKVAAARAMQGPNPYELPDSPTEACDAWEWQQTFAHYSHATDPVEDAESVIGMAESFSRQEPCS